jgi:hypothetical protein
MLNAAAPPMLAPFVFCGTATSTKPVEINVPEPFAPEYVWTKYRSVPSAAGTEVTGIVQPLEDV